MKYKIGIYDNFAKVVTLILLQFGRDGDKTIIK